MFGLFYVIQKSVRFSARAWPESADHPVLRCSAAVVEASGHRLSLAGARPSAARRGIPRREPAVGRLWWGQPIAGVVRYWASLRSQIPKRFPRGSARWANSIIPLSITGTATVAPSCWAQSTAACTSSTST